jgi:hypothetical protein
VPLPNVTNATPTTIINGRYRFMRDRSGEFRRDDSFVKS